MWVEGTAEEAKERAGCKTIDDAEWGSRERGGSGKGKTGTEHRSGCVVVRGLHVLDAGDNFCRNPERATDVLISPANR